MNTAPETGPVTPAGLRELAARAEALAVDIKAVQAVMRAGDDPTRAAGFRLDVAAGDARKVGAEMVATAEDLARVRGRSNCFADWGTCPEHGNTLTSSGGQSWCRAAGCHRGWDYDRGGLPCREPAAYRGTDAEGGQFLACEGHAIAVREQLIGATLAPLTTGNGPA